MSSGRMRSVRPTSSSDADEYRRTTTTASAEAQQNGCDNRQNGCMTNGTKRLSEQSATSGGSCASALLASPTVAIWSLVFVLVAAFASLQYYLPKASSSACLCPQLQTTAGGQALPGIRPYNESSIGTPKTLPDGRIRYEIAVVSDLDQHSIAKDKAGKDTWRSFLRRGHLFFHPEHLTAKVDWTSNAEDALHSQLAYGGRAMELSDLCVYDGHLLTVDDRTGVVYKIDAFEHMNPWVLLNDGPGNTTKGFKGEWMTVRDRHLYVGGLGKEWTTVDGKFINNNPMFVKVINPYGEVLHVDWTERYKALRRMVGVEFPGYMIHESAQWSAVHNKWFFLPRRAANSTYSETEDEHMGVNILLIADEDFTNIEVRHIGSKGDGYRGFSAFQFLPNTGDDIIVAVKSEERDGKAVASYLFIFRLSDGQILMDDQKFDGPYKFEGLIVY